MKKIKGFIYKITYIFYYIFSKKKISLTSTVLIGNNSQINMGKQSSINSFIYLNMSNKSILNIGANSSIGRFSEITISSKSKILIGKNVFIGERANIRARTTIEIGDYCRIAQGVSIISGQYNYKDKNKLIKDQGFCENPIVIKDDVWLGTGVTVLMGVTIGAGAVIGAGTVVSKDIPEYAIVVGSPHRIIGYRN
jgi:acetyltransferase-like isoleucine patch superfamily enzyme